MNKAEIRRIAEAIKCLALLLEVVSELFPDFAPMLEDLEDEMLDKLQDER